MTARSLRSFVRDESGATAVEYGLLAAVLSVVVIAGITTLGTTLYAKFTNLSAAVK